MKYIARDEESLPGSARVRTWLASAPSLDVSSPSRTDCAFHLSFNPREQWHRFPDNMPIRQLPPLRIRE